MKRGETSSMKKVERKIVEKHRRIQMKVLCFKMVSLIPNSYLPQPKEFLSQQDQLHHSVAYIEILRERLKELRRRKTQLTNINTDKIMNYVKELDCGVEVVLISGLIKNFRLHDVITIIEQEAAEVLTVNISTIDGKIIHTIHAQNDRDEESGFTFEHVETSAQPHSDSPNMHSSTHNYGGRGMEILHPVRNEITHNQILANDELYVAPNENPGMVLTTDLFDKEQMQVSSQNSDVVEQSALYLNQRPPFKKEGFRRKLTNEEKYMLKCDHCGKTDHLVIDCFEVNGVPDCTYITTYTKEPYPDIGKVIKSEITKHFSSYMSQNKGESQRFGSSTESANVAELEFGADTVEYSGHFAFGISAEIRKDEWIVDSGASNHMSCRASLLTNLRKLNHPLRIFLPYVGQLTKSLNGRVVFLESHCLVQLKTTGSTLGIGKMKGSLYAFNHDDQEQIPANATCNLANSRGDAFFCWSSFHYHNEAYGIVS
ncbi:hypothetical protein C2S52_001780 [Perilla frutescens var. hirtella]|nr:hypothetical protein C2S52_001780 [Perilla frutescens var. hirtella]